jgi:hypothetical protein
MGYQDYLAEKQKSDNAFSDEEINRLIKTESSFNPHAINKETKAMGYGQFTPETFAALNKQGIKFDPFDEEQSKGAIKTYLNMLYKQTGNKEKALAAYGGFVTKDPSSYVNKILQPSEETPKTQSILEKKLSQLETGEKPAKEQGLTAGKTSQLVARGMAAPLAGATIGSAAGPGGAILGSMALPIGDVLNTAINKVAGTHLQMPSEVAQKYLTEAGLPEPKTMGERTLESVGSALASTGAQLPKFAQMATKSVSPMLRSFASQMAEAPAKQLAVAAPSAAVSQVATELTGSPLVGAIAGATTGAPAGIKTGRLETNAPTSQLLADQAKNLYQKAEQSGIKLDVDKFTNHMDQIGKDLRKFGYAENSPTYSGIKSALDELKDTTRPKDYLELQALREIIAGEQSSNVPKVRMLASKLKDEFDDFIMNPPEGAIVGGNKEGLQNWKDARDVYSKMKKSETFEEMLNRAELDKTKYTQSGAENSLAMQLRNLAKNQKKMRLFTPEEQDAITEAAKGGTLQKGLKQLSRFAPTGPMSSLFDLELIKELPLVGSTVAFSAGAAKKLAEQRKIQTVSNLADMMRLGAAPQMESRFKQVPVTSLRGLLSAGSNQ